MNIEQVRKYTLSLYGVTEDQPFGTVQLNVKFFDERSGKADYRKAVPTTEPEHCEVEDE